MSESTPTAIPVAEVSAEGATTRAEVARALYAKREKIYPREVHGMFARLRATAVIVLLGLFYGVCWLHWNGQQLVLFDLPARQFHVFGLTFFPQDFLYLTCMLIIAALSLFFFTAIAGRLWCGYACPQTVWTEAFMWIERKFEGDRPQQMKLDRGPPSARRRRIKALKHATWIAFALWTGFTFVGYFTPVLDLGARVLSFSLGPWETFWILFYGFATYGNAGWMREQVCLYMCPYARFQSAMFDRDTLVISYDRARGEPRGGRKRGTDLQARGLGSCIDCTLCVQACPTGIDIRDGLQYECIGCAACIDVCDQVMDKMGYPRGLVRYTTENAVSGEPARVVRPRVIIYGCVLVALIAALGVSIALRTPLALDVLRDRNALYRETSEGLIVNGYTLKLVNMDNRDHRFTVSVDGLDGLALTLDEDAVDVPAGKVVAVPASVSADPASLPGRSNEIVFSIRSTEEPELAADEPARFLGPAPER